MKSMSFALVAAMVAACSASSSGTGPADGGAANNKGGGFGAIINKGGSSGGTGTTPPADGGGGTTGPTNNDACSGLGGSDACGQCLNASCCNEMQACAGNQSCTALINCANACTEQTCYENCIQSNQAGAQALQPLITCAQNNCAACN